MEFLLKFGVIAGALACAFSTMAVPADACLTKPERDELAMEGKWKVVSQEIFGEKFDGGAIITYMGIVTHVKFENAKLYIQDDLGMRAWAEIHVHGDKLNNYIDLRFPYTTEDGKPAVRVKLGIYEFGKDTLTICYNFMEGPRPTSTGSTRNDFQEVLVLKRVK